MKPLSTPNVKYNKITSWSTEQWFGPRTLAASYLAGSLSASPRPLQPISTQLRLGTRQEADATYLLSITFHSPGAGLPQDGAEL